MESSKAVFLSYASEDADAADRVCQGLRSAGIEVWFDRSDLRGGDAWDQKIRRNIKDCALFLPVVSANTNARAEGYFRLEWKLAVDRSHLMSAERAFLLPVVIDDTTDGKADVPDRFREVQWTRVPAGEVPVAFVKLVSRLLEPEDAQSAPTVSRILRPSPNTSPAQQVPQRNAFFGVALVAALAVAIAGGWYAFFGVALVAALAVAIAGGWYWKQHSSSAGSVVAKSDSVLPTESIAVLPFVNMSSDKEQEYFSDGLAEELLNLLAQLPQLRVIARTSSFSFKGKENDVATIAKVLNVSTVLEGSVRKSGDTVRITAQLIRASDSSHLWSETYDRKLTDVLKVQDEIAGAVVAALKVKLLPAQKIANQRGTSNTEAHQLYLQGKFVLNQFSMESAIRAADFFQRAVALDPDYAAAYAGLANAELGKVLLVEEPVEQMAKRQHALVAAEKAIALAPELADGYVNRGFLRMNLRDLTGAGVDFSKALALDPGDSNVQRVYGLYLQTMGRMAEALAAMKKAIELDPLAASAWNNLGDYYLRSGQLKEAREPLNRALSISPNHIFATYNLARTELLDKRPQEALLLFRRLGGGIGLSGVAMAEHSLGHAKESQQAQDELIAKYAQTHAVRIADTYAWRGEKNKAFEWLEHAYAQQEFPLIAIKTNPVIATLRDDPRYSALVKKLGLPD